MYGQQLIDFEFLFVQDPDTLRDVIVGADCIGYFVSDRMKMTASNVISDYEEYIAGKLEDQDIGYNLCQAGVLGPVDQFQTQRGEDRWTQQGADVSTEK